MPTAKNTDNELWAAIRNDEEWAFTALFDRYLTKLYNVSYKYFKDRESCEEIVHDVFLNIWSRRAELDIISIENFLTRAVRYQIHNRMRLSKLNVEFMGDQNYEELIWEPNKGVERIQTEELEQQLDVYLDQLPKRCTEIFKMSRLKNLSNQEIASELGISKRTVENQIAISIKHLRVCYKNVALSLLFILFFL